MHIIAVSGSLRDKSSNTILLKAMSHIASNEVDISLFGEINNLPHFNPDLDIEIVPQTVTNLRNTIKSAQGIVFSSPEYAHGVPGALKNALDWLVSSGEFVDKPVALINTSSRAHHAQEQLVEILKTMTAKVYTEMSVTILLSGRNLNVTDITEDVELSGSLRSFIAGFADFVEGEAGAVSLN